MSQIVNLIGIVDDGSDLAPTMPRDTATTISIPKAADVTINVNPYFPSGDPVPFPTMDVNWTAKLMVANAHRGRTKTELELSATRGNGPDGPNLVFALVPKDTEFLELQRYLFDVWLLMSGKRYQVVSLSALRLEDGLLAP